MSIDDHPGRVLLHEFLGDGLSAAGLARVCGVPTDTIIDLTVGKIDVTPELAAVLSDALGTTQAFWLNQQRAYDEQAAHETEGIGDRVESVMSARGRIKRSPKAGTTY